MKISLSYKNPDLLARFRSLFRTRDFFLHDGTSLRHFKLTARVQMAAAGAALALAALPLLATVQIAVGASQADEVAAMQDSAAAMRADAVAMKRDAAAQLAEIERRESALVSVAKNITDARYKDTSALVRALGMAPARFHRSAGGMGGPYEPVDPKAAKAADPQFKALFTSWKKLDQLEQGVMAIPSLKPVSNMLFSSSFGVRSDPFRGSAAMHAGVDIPGPIGTPIYATADGIVGRSQWVSGYGNMVEVDHGKGIQTRYGHLSKLIAKPNSRVKRGELIGLMGSTGRSTGSHLHYEVRIDGRAVNPMPFIQSSDYLLAVQQRAAGGTQIAQGGPADD